MRQIWITPALALLFLAGLSGCSGPGKKSDLTPEQQAKLHYKKGVAAIYERNVPLALAELAECLRIDPKNMKCRWESGWANFADLNFEEASRYWAEIQKERPRYPGLKAGLEQLAEFKKIADTAATLKKKSPRTRAAPENRKAEIRLVGIGDTMIGSSYPRGMMPPEGENDPKPLAQIREYFEGADIGFANLEGTICEGGLAEKCLTPKPSPSPTLPTLPLIPGGEDDEELEDEPEAVVQLISQPSPKPSPSATPRRCYAFRSPPRMGNYLKDAGINLASLANNHIQDFGDQCRADTEKNLDSLGIKYSGRPGTFSEMEIRGIKVAMVAFHSNTHSNNSLDFKAGAKLVREIRKDFPIVIVSFHGGAEGFAAMHVTKKPEIFAGENRGDVVRFAHTMIDAGASLVLGHGPHVPRAMEFYKGRLIAYSLGNFATYRLFNLSGFNQLAPMLDISLDKKGRFVSGKIVPFRQLGQGIPTADTHGTAIDIVRFLSHEDFPKTGAQFAQDGSIVPPWERRKRR